MTLAQRADEEIVEAVVVVIADCDSESEHGNCQACFAGYISEGSVVIVVIELESARRAGMSGPILAIDQHNVGIAIIVVVDERAPRPHRFRQILLSEGTVVVNEVNPSLLSNVAEMDLLGEGDSGQTN